LFVLGHVGIGPRLLGRVRERLPYRWLILGCLLPDLIDKPLYYFGPPWALITGSRTFGHTGLFLLALLAGAVVSRAPAAWAVFAGVATHLVLDIVGELFTGADANSTIWLAVLFPLLGVRFPIAYFHDIFEHLMLSARSFYVIAGELIGLAILIYERARRQSV
jgi:hypothetical protein